TGQVVKPFSPAETGRIAFKKETMAAVMTGLRAAVNEPYGTGWYHRLKDVEQGGEPVLMAGKTGTAQVVALGRERLKAAEVDYFERDHAWFAGFAPADDPQIVVVALNEHSGFGSANAAPTVSAVIKKYFDLLKDDELERAGGPKPAPEPAPKKEAPKPALPDAAKPK